MTANIEWDGGNSDSITHKYYERIHVWNLIFVSSVSILLKYCGRDDVKPFNKSNMYIITYCTTDLFPAFGLVFIVFKRLWRLVDPWPDINHTLCLSGYNDRSSNVVIVSTYAK